MILPTGKVEISHTHRIKEQHRDFPGSPVVKILLSSAGGYEFNPWLGS